MVQWCSGPFFMSSTPPRALRRRRPPLQSLVALRLYATFNMTALRNEARAAVLAAEADRLEDAAAKESHRAAHSAADGSGGGGGGHGLRLFAQTDLDVFADNVAVVTSE
jgi:hypothetical protein